VIRTPLTRPLSPREQQIVDKLNAGRTPKEVAAELGVANATVRVLLSRALKKGGSIDPPPERPKSPGGMALSADPPQVEDNLLARGS
jgi:predicted transcriptional regulator